MTLPRPGYLRRARDSALASALAAFTAARTSTGRVTITAWCDCCATCDVLRPGFSASHTHRGTGLELARLTPSCTGCGSGMARVGTVAAHFLASALPARAALARLLVGHEQPLRTAPLFRCPAV